MVFAKMTWRESLRDIEACLSAQSAKLYHMGLRKAVARSTLADANESRDWRIWADFAQVLIRKARELYAAEPPNPMLPEWYGRPAMSQPLHAVRGSSVRRSAPRRGRCAFLQRPAP